VFYFYACVNLDLLIENLGEDTGLAAKACGAFAEAMATVLPGGKQNTHAAFARASYMLVERGTRQPRTLANAFNRAVRGNDQVVDSIAALRRWRDQLTSVYGPMINESIEMDINAFLDESKDKKEGAAGDEGNDAKAGKDKSQPGSKERPAGDEGNDAKAGKGEIKPGRHTLAEIVEFCRASVPCAA
jgi:hypothetical protein